MGQQSATPPFELPAESPALPICTITRPRSLEARGGGFDVPKEKCPPDIRSGGSLSEVTVRSAPSCTFDSKTATHHLLQSLSTPSTPVIQQPRPIKPQVYLSNHQAPFELPLTPPNSTPGSSPERQYQQHEQGSKPINIKTSTKVVNGFTVSLKEPAPLITPPSTPDHSNPALPFLQDVFPGAGARSALPCATSITIEQDGATWEGIVLALPGKPKTLYVNGKGAESVQLRESIVALLDLAGEHLDCEAFVIALERKSSSLAGLIHSLLYVSGTVVSRSPFEVDEKYVLVGIEI